MSRCGNRDGEVPRRAMLAPMRPPILRLAVPVLLGGCGAVPSASELAMPGDATPGFDGSRVLTATEVEFPLQSPGKFPRAVRGADGRTYVSWLSELEGRRVSLRFVEWFEGSFSAARTIAEGDDWFVNWADFPSVAAAADGTLAAHWLQQNGGGRYAYGVRVASSTDGGVSWGEPFWLHEDQSAAEHGFATLVPGDDGGFTGVWLDGRDVRETGSMTLRSRTFDASGPNADEVLIDPKVCDCCPTDAVFSDGDLVAVYRDRTDAEIRDISRLRRTDGVWGEADACNNDLWFTPG